MQVSASIALVLVVCIARVISKQASLRILLSLFYWHWLSGSPARLEMQRGWMAKWQRRRASEPFLVSSPRSCQRTHNKLWAFFTLISTCFLKIGLEFKIATRYLSNTVHCRITPKSWGLRRPGSSFLSKDDKVSLVRINQQVIIIIIIAPYFCSVKGSLY